MMVSSADEFNALAYGTPHASTVNYLRDRFQQTQQNLHILTDAGKSFMADARAMFDRFNSPEALAKVRAVIRKMSNIFQSDAIYPIVDLGRLQQANINNQRWIMANPMARQLYFDQRIDGYSETYVDPFPGLKGEDDYNYRRVMTGLVQDYTDEAGVESWRVSIYPDELHAGDRELEFEEQRDIKHSTWAWLEYFLEDGQEDPTSRSGGML